VKNFFLGVLTTLAVLVVGGFAYLRLGWAEVRGDLPPSRFESYLMAKAVHASVRRSAPEMANPVAPTEENLIAGGKIYLGECSGCHGTPGARDSESISDSLFPPIPQLPKAGTEYSEAQIFWIAKHGVRRTGMFANGRIPTKNSGPLPPTSSASSPFPRASSRSSRRSRRPPHSSMERAQNIS